MKFNLLKICVLCALFGVIGQFDVIAQNRWAFNQTHFNFGELSKNDSIVECIFKLYNRSSKTLIINDVVADCNCLTIEYSKKPIKLGETVQIKIRFNPKGQNGRFYKPIYVYHNLSKEPDELIVRGVVKVEDSKKYFYPYELSSGILVTSESLHLGLVSHGQFVVGQIGIYNIGNKRVSFDVDNNDSEYLRIEIKPNHLDSKQQEIIKFVFAAQDTSMYGTVNQLLRLKINEQIFRVPIYVTVVDDFSKIGDRAAQLKIDKQFFLLGELPMNKMVTLKVMLQNVGDEELIIRKLNPSGDCLRAVLNNYRINPGEKTELQIIVKSTSVNKINESVELICNDPIKPMREIRVVANMSE